MSKTKFTKGKWVANGAFVSHEDLGCDAIVSGAGCKEINYKEAEANAFLIAASPDMYYEIEKDISILESQLISSETHGEASRLQDRLICKINLLKKARGEL